MLSSSLRQTALQALSSAIGKDKTERHAFIVSQVSTIIALALCKAPPKGVGNPADHGKLVDVFTKAGMPRYAEHCAAFPQALKGRMRSLDSWEQAQEDGAAVAVAAFAGCAPRTVSPEAQAVKDAKRAAKKVEADKAAKLAERDAKDADKAARQEAFNEGAASVVITPTMVADLIKAGAFTLEAVADALGYDVAEVVAEPVAQ